MNLLHFYTFPYYLMLYETSAGCGRQVSLSAWPATPTGMLLYYGSYRRLSVAERGAIFWTKELKEKITFAHPNEPIFLISGFASEYRECSFYNVIIGERTGWIIIPNWLSLTPIEEKMQNEH